jgi:hypothetical protein
VFSADSPFVLRDSRRHRPVLPTTAESLNFRHEILLPGRVVTGASLLDLGCCIGATGHWVLGRGASSYLGVEMQAGFAEVAAELLAGSPNARIACMDSEHFLEESQERFDIVCALGLVHGLFDPILTLRRAAHRARTYFCFEDFGNHLSMPALVVEPSTPMPVAGEQAGTIGFGWSFSPEALSLVMKFLGFERDCAETFVSGNRWMCRYRRVRNTEEQSASYAKVKRSWI